jgi:hypothetical protein
MSNQDCHHLRRISQKLVYKQAAHSLPAKINSKARQKTAAVEKLFVAGRNPVTTAVECCVAAAGLLVIE